MKLKECSLPPPSTNTFLRSSTRRRTIVHSKSRFNQTNANLVPLFRTSLRYTKRQLEYDLQQKIDLEIKMREGTSKLLAACKHMNQTLEAAKSLLTSDVRLNEFRSELQNRKSNYKNKLKKISSSKAKASISDIRIPLIWKDTDYFKNKGDYRRFAVFCLLQIGTEIYDSIMVNVDRHVTDICFDDAFQFNDIQPDFNFKLSIYARVMHDDLSIASTHKKLTRKISNSVSRSLGRKFTNLKNDLESESDPKFYLMASANLNLNDASDSIKTYDLVIENVEKNLELPLFGHFCCRLAVQPLCQLKEYISGLVNFQNSSEPEYILFWCSLKNFKLHFWNVKEELREEPVFLKHTLMNQTPDKVIPIDRSTKVSQTDVILIESRNHKCRLKPFSSHQVDWHKSLLSCIQDFKSWEPIAEYQMDLAPVTHHRSQYFLRDRPHGSLYNETPIQDHEIKKHHSKSLSNVSFNDSTYRFKSNFNII